MTVQTTPLVTPLHLRSRADLAARRQEIRTAAEAYGRLVEAGGKLDQNDEHRIGAMRTEADEIDAILAVQAPIPAQGGTRRAYDQVHRVGNEQRTYNPESDRTGERFARDLAAASLGFGDFEARGRMERHAAEERVERPGVIERASSTGSFTGAVIPAYLTDMYASSARAMRPFADICRHHDLPETGMTVNIGRITTGSTSAEQTSENSSVSNQDVDDTLLTANVITAAGQQTVSRQGLERGLGVEELIIEDLLEGQATELDRMLLNRAVTGLTNIATSNTYTSASPTGAELYPKFALMSSAAETATLGKAPSTHVLMHSRRWFWLSGQLTSQWPAFASANIPTQAIGMNAAGSYNSGVRGMLPNGLGVIVDNNISTTVSSTQDEIFLISQKESHLWEDPKAPVMLRCEQPAAGSLGVLFVCYSYFAHTFGRYPGAFQKLVGTGLNPPVF